MLNGGEAEMVSLKGAQIQVSSLVRTVPTGRSQRAEA